MSSGTRTSVKQLIRAAARAYTSWNRLLETIIPKLPNPLEEKIYTLKTARPPDLSSMAEKLKEAGHQNLVEKILNKPPKILVGFLYSLSETGNTVYDTYLYMLKKAENCPSITIEDFSTDALTVSDIIAREKPDKTIIITAKSRQRPAGIYTTQITVRHIQENPAEKLRASLEGSLDIDALLDALQVLAPGLTVILLECDPGNSTGENCGQRLIQVADKILQEVCRK